MANFIKNIESSDDFLILQFHNTSFNAFAAIIDFAMLKEGYKLVDGSKGNGEYERGSRTLRIIFGAIAKYFRFTINLKITENQCLELLIQNTSNNFAKSVIGKGQVKAEINRLAKVFTLI